MTPDVNAFFDEATNTVTYVVSDPGSKVCAVIDPVLDFEPASGRTSTSSVQGVIDFVEAHGLEVAWILETHAHADHLSAAQVLKSSTGGQTGIGKLISESQAIFKNLFNLGDEFLADGSQFDCLLDDGEILALGTMEIRVMHTPGHTPACLTYVIGDCAFIGDTLFMPDFGTARADFPGGDAAVLYRSIQGIFTLPGTTRLWMCHDYKAAGRDVYAWQTTVAEQMANNVHIHAGISEQEFVEFRTKRDLQLGMPKLILPSVQVNIRAGKMPPAEDNGVVYLKLPVDAHYMDIRRISPFLSVSPQIYTAHMEKIASLGFKTIINNRPDKETDDQPFANELAAEAAKNGMVFINQPVISGKVTLKDAANFTGELKRARGPVLAFCRSGTRCTILWALSEARHMDVDAILSFAKSIGYDLKAHRDTMDQIAAQASSTET